MKAYRTRRLTVEGLEQRQLMAGDVTVAVDIGRILTLTGDGNDNGIVITTQGKLTQVVGLEHGGSMTTVNGDHRLTFKNIRQVVVNFGSGDDALAVTNTTLVGSLTVQTGDGDDLVGIGDFDNERIEHAFGLTFAEHWIHENVEPLLGALTVKRDVSIDLGDGENELRGRATTIGRNLSVTSGVDHDIVHLEGSGISGESGYFPGVKTGLDTTISTGDGDDWITLDRYVARNLTISSDADHDRIHLTDLAISRDITLSGGDGYDDMRLTNTVSKKLKLSGDAGDDDTFLKNVTVTAASSNDGGEGDNIYYDLGGNTGSPLLRRRHYETVVSS